LGFPDRGKLLPENHYNFLLKQAYIIPVFPHRVFCGGWKWKSTSGGRREEAQRHPAGIEVFWFRVDFSWGTPSGWDPALARGVFSFLSSTEVYYI
jgi:hypothetical protein